MVRRSKDKDNLPDNKWEFGAFLVKNWWKAFLLILVSGLVVTGFKCNFRGNSIEKAPIYQKSVSK